MGADYEELDAKRIIEKIRESLKPRLQATPPPAPAPPPPPAPASSHLVSSDQPVSPGAGSDSIAQDLSLLHAGFDIYHIPLKSHRRVLGRTVVFAKKLLRQLLTPLLERQVAYNAANTRVVQTLKNQVESLLQAHTASATTLQGELDRRTAALQADLAQRGAAHTELERRTGALQAAHTELQGELDRRTMALQADLELLRTGLAQGAAAHMELQADLDRRTAALQAALEPLRAHQRDHAAILEIVTAQIRDLQRHRDATREQIARAERALRRILHALEREPTRQREPGKPRREPTMPHAESLVEPEFDYAGFEERFRGSEAEIKERQRRHLRHLEGKEPVLDIGCGRGEFLELLREAGIKGRGVDLSLDMVLLCQEKSLDIARADAFAYLEEVSDNSLGGVFSAQFIEHFPPKEIISLTRLCYQKLKPQGILIFETVNPACLTVFARSFFLDLSHVWPYHPDSMKYLFETTGFTDIGLDFFSPVDPALKLPSIWNGNLFGKDTDLYNRAVELVNDLLFGYQDYAIVGRKAPMAALAM